MTDRDLPEAVQVMIRAVHEQNAGVLDSLVDAGVEALLREGAARVRGRVEAVADWCAAKEADMRASIGIDGYSEGARDAYDVTESRIRAALTDEAAP